MDSILWMRVPPAGRNLRCSTREPFDERPPLCRSVSPSPHFLLQMLIEINEASAVITWDFDVSKGDVIFNIYHSKRAPQPPKKDTLGAHGITSPGAVNAQTIDRNWVLGQDYSMVEKALICREGESVQVREIMLHPCALLSFLLQFQLNFIGPRLLRLHRRKLKNPSAPTQTDGAALLC